MSRYSATQKIRQFLAMGCGGALTFCGYSYFTGNERFYSQCLMPTLHKIVDAEGAHHLAIWAAKNRLLFGPKLTTQNRLTMASKFAGLELEHPIGLAAGFDKDAEAVEGLSGLGFSFVEVGSVTPVAQPGNEKPRVFRLTQDEAVINRYGFNSLGHEAMKQRLVASKKKRTQCVLGVNLGKNKTSLDPVADYVQGVKLLGGLADYLVINVSSPNTPGLRSLQGSKQLELLITSVLAARDQLDHHNKPPVLLKIAPDLTQQDKQDIARVVTNTKCKIDGLIISNTTVTRPEELKSPLKSETGGLSGKPLNKLSTETIRDMYRLTRGSIPIIGVGGISNGQDAYDKIRAGAQLVQLYTAFVYQGPPVIQKINNQLQDLLIQDGFQSLQEAVGADHKK